MGEGTLFVVATPIGNLADLTTRALETLREADAVIAEDTRRTRGMLTHFGISRPLLSLPAFDEQNRVEPLVRRLVEGQNLALVTDAGTPGVSDPGGLLVDAAWNAGVRVVPIPGASASLAAISASGLRTERFFFAGFLPRKGGARRDALDELLRSRAAVVIFEAGNRVAATLTDLADALGPRRALVARELTKLHEELARAPLPELASRFADGARGEVVIVVDAPGEGAPPAEEELPPLEEAIAARLAAGDRLKDLSRALAEAYRLPRQEVYARALRLRADEEAPE